MSINYTFPFELGDGQSTKPNKSDIKYDGHQELYYLDFAKWVIYSSYETKHTAWIDKIDINTRFYQNDQWSTKEDIETFLKDETGSTRNRIMVKINQIRPMIELFRGNAQRMTIDAYAKSISKNVNTRKEDALGKLLFTQEIAEEFQNLGEIIKSQNPEIEDTREDTELNFNQTYVDEYVTNINRLIEFVKENNDMNEMQVRVAEQLAFSGLGIIEEFKQGEHLRKEVVDSREFFWDRNAKRPDLQDAAFQGRLSLMTSSDILERWQNISQSGKEAIKNHASQVSSGTDLYSSNNSIPVYKIFFQDQETKTAGYVKDEFDQDYLVYINENDEYSDGKVWKEEDLIDPPKTKTNEKLFKGKKTRKVVVSVMKYCFYIPGEAIAGSNSEGKKHEYDVLLEWGKDPYQEDSWLDLSVVNYPFKSYAWSYVNGIVSSPIDDIINPQRLINRIMSSLESQINNAGGAGITYDKSMIDPDDEDELLKDSKAGRPIGLDTRGKGITNAIGTYDNTVKTGTYQMFQLIPIMEGLIKNMTGVNEAMRGESTGSDQLVGVTEMLMQRGSLMQEPFYNALARVFVQSHQSTATRGKKIYAENQRELVDIVGEDGVLVFQLSEGMANEDFRVFIKRSESKESQIASGDRNLMILLEAGLINKNQMADMFGRSTVEQVTSKLRQIANKEIIAQKKAEEEQAAAQKQAAQEQAETEQQMIAQAQEQERQDKVLDIAKDRDAHARKLDEIVVQGQVNQNKNV